MRIRIHFAVGSTAMTKVFNLEDIDFADFSRSLERNRRDDTVVGFMNSSGESFAVAARSIVLVEQVSS